jgi:hypothetical protein
MGKTQSTSAFESMKIIIAVKIKSKSRTKAEMTVE